MPDMEKCADFGIHYPQKSSTSRALSVTKTLRRFLTPADVMSLSTGCSQFHYLHEMQYPKSKPVTAFLFLPARRCMMMPDFAEFGGDRYYLTFVEKEAMQQDVVADANFMAEGISSTGHVAIYGIFFDTDKSEIKPESEPTLAEMAKLLKTNATLNVFIVGHTDNSGTFEHNMKLSQDRAAAVVSMLAGKHGIATARLRPMGAASLAPVSSNKTEEGKAKNRRVELVER
jgi:outer membrane protein OmpA-like peptidoglycan-associated protein